MIIINDNGRAQIRAILESLHWHHTAITDAAVEAWAAEAEQHAMDGNGCYIELAAAESIFGVPISWDITPEGYDDRPDA